MEIRTFLVQSGRLVKGAPSPTVLDPATSVDTWYDLQNPGEVELDRLLEPLELHPLILERCLNPGKAPGVITYGDSVLLTYPVFSSGAGELPFLAVALVGHLLISVRHGSVPALDKLSAELEKAGGREVSHLAELLYIILDELTDESVAAQTALRDQTRRLTADIALSPGSVNLVTLEELRSEVDRLVILVENQLYCVSGLAASSAALLQQPHRHAYMQDLQSELEIAQRGIYRLEGRVDDLFQDLAAASNDRVEKRLRVLTIVSAITLPLGLLTGLLGMNVGGIPGTDQRYGFWWVLLLMGVVSAALLLFFRRRGWFE